MAHKALVASAGLLLLCAMLSALEPPSMGSSSTEWNLTFFSSNQALPADSLVEVRYLMSSGPMAGQYAPKTLLAIRNNGHATLYTRESRLAVRLVHDDLNTPADDEIWTGLLDAADGTTIHVILQPMAYLGGRVDGTDGQPAANAQMELTCQNGLDRKWNASDTGTFALDDLRPASCVLTASKDGKVARQDVELEKGRLQYVSFRLGDDWENLLGFAGAMIVVAGLGYSVHRYFSDKYQKEKEPSPKGRIQVVERVSRKMAKNAREMTQSAIAHAGPSPRQKDLMQTLGKPENEVIRYLLKSAPAGVKASKLRRDLLVPKTSFWRIMSALERKQMVKLQKDGSRVYVGLHEFFLKE
ncbi:MAG: hypothetical protein V1728_05460 [Candidatus Micrarchaeota archaeon]